MKSFDELRPLLEKQYEHAQYAPESGWSEAELRDCWQNHCAQHPGESRLAQRTFVTSLILEHAPVAREEFNPFCGKFQDFGILNDDLCQNGYDHAKQHFPDYIWGRADVVQGIGYAIDRSHVAPDWHGALTLGLPGMIERARRGNSEFHRMVAAVYESLATFCRRAGKLNGNPVMERIADHAPETLHEAFQLAYVLHDAIEYAGEEVRTMGRFDELYIDFYRRDIAAGRLDRAGAKELVKCFWIAFYARYQGKRFGKNFCFGPRFNELSYLGMEAYYEMNVVDPKLSVLVTADMPQDFAELYAKCIRDGRNSIVSLNYDVIVEGLVKHGRTREDAENFIPIGCYEPAVAGKEISCSGATHLYLPCILLHTLYAHTGYQTFDGFMAAYRLEIEDAVQIMAKRQRVCEAAWPEVNPVPLLSGTFAGCMAKGLDITSGGAEYNTTGCVISYIADAVDSLAAIQYLVFERKLCTLAELRTALQQDWKGYEKLQLEAQMHAPKWGNNDDRVDALAVELSDFCSRLLSREPNGRGGNFFPSLYGQLVVERGRMIGALPDGRNAGTPVSKNMDACIAMDRDGITSLMNSVLKVDMTLQPCGTCLDLMLHPSSIRGAAGIANMVAIIRSFIARGGSGLQFNIFDAAILRDAQKHPENYTNLQVRVCGWNVHFNDLEPAAQETFIRQAEAIA